MSDYREICLDVPLYTRDRGTPVEFEEETRIHARVDGGSTVIAANAAGFRTLARLCLTLAADDVPDGAHVHLGEFAGLLPGTSEVIVERAELA